MSRTQCIICGVIFSLAICYGALAQSVNVAQIEVIKPFKPEIVGGPSRVPPRMQNQQTGRSYYESSQRVRRSSVAYTQQMKEFERNIPIGQCGESKVFGAENCTSQSESCQLELRSERCYLETILKQCPPQFDNRLVGGDLGREIKFCIERNKGEKGSVPELRSSPSAG